MKPHYPILDGLRGTAAIMVVIYHLFEAYYPVVGNHPTPHGYMAVQNTDSNNSWILSPQSIDLFNYSLRFFTI